MNPIQRVCYSVYKKPYRTDGKAFYPKLFKSRYKIGENFVDAHRLVTVELPDAGRRHIVFLHGGAYICEANLVHRIMTEKLADEGFRVTCFDYPMAPEHTAEYTNDWIVRAYEKIVSLYPDDEFAVFGDSAGGGLAIILLMLLRDRGIRPMPKRTVVSSPWLDVSMKNPEILDYLEQDILLSFDALVYAGKLYAGGIETTSPQVSPIYGNPDGLGEILMFYSSKELLTPDCEKFAEIAKQARGTALTAVRAEGLFHCYLMFPPLKESKEAFEKIKAFLRQ